ncbi:MAG: hypothetical protein Q9227_000664 [Pyrenula ochraceoflavens]
MAQYYGGAYLTIAAGPAADCPEGFLGLRAASLPTWKLPFCVRTSPNNVVPIGSVYAHQSQPEDEIAPSYQLSGPLERRAWTYQESFLSPRVLRFGKKQTTFRCRRGISYEDGNFIRNKDINMILAFHTTGLSEIPPQLLPRSKEIVPTLHQRTHLLKLWYCLLEQYSARSMTNANDRLVAFSGVAQRFRPLLGGKYMHGIWESDIIRGLAWHNWNLHYSFPWKIPADFRLKLEFCGQGSAPSWSWASYSGPITMHAISSMFRDQDTYHAYVLSHENVPHSFGGPQSNGNISSVLKLCGKLFPVSKCESQTLDTTRPLKRSPSKAPLRWQPRSQLPSLLEARSGQIVTTRIVGIGIFDIDGEDIQEIIAVPLLNHAGILVTTVGFRKYRRVGCLIIQDDKWFEEGVEQELTLV